ncbi:HvfB family MNIO-type RiPP peptide maturase [Stenotrophomonas rhizophila]|uniref:HvfB family MNIO-type RiPP peptide maturase n=1 Tax=Stenotrophomonas rhizophila TaxID=216778 RepID=UPI003D18C018
MPSTDPGGRVSAPPPLPAAAVGLGLRRALLDDLEAAPAGDFDFVECAPENWIGLGGAWGERLHALSARYPLSCHGLSLSLGGSAPLDLAFIDQVGRFLQQHQVRLYSEHLSYCSDDGHLYDLLPLPFTDEAVHHTAARIAQVQDRLGRRIAVENVSTYLTPHQAMSELDFTCAVLAEADCDLLLDVNNVYVNAVNHGYDPQAFIDGLPAGRVVCMHVAGHYDEADDLKIDTHGSPVIDPVWALLRRACARFGPRPTLLERDFNFPPYAELRQELQQVRCILDAAARGQAAA